MVFYCFCKLRFAQRVSLIKNKAEINEEVNNIIVIFINNIQVFLYCYYYKYN